MSELPESANARVGYCALLGRPNAGKSTLLNRLLGVPFAAVSPRPQTTRNRLLGIHNYVVPELSPAKVQALLIDTPGVQDGQSALGRFMRGQTESGAQECDVALFVVDATRAVRRPQAVGTALPENLLTPKVARLIALNKVDAVAKPLLLPVLAALGEVAPGVEVIPISARTGDGKLQLEAAIARALPCGAPLFGDNESYTDRSERFIAAELIREQLVIQLGQELPYATAVAVEAFEERPDRNDVVISAVIAVEKSSQKAIVIGAQGSRLKELGSAARRRLSALLGCTVHVRLFVKVVEDWTRQERKLPDWGYE